MDQQREGEGTAHAGIRTFDYSLSATITPDVGRRSQQLRITLFEYTATMPDFTPIYIDSAKFTPAQLEGLGRLQYEKQKVNGFLPFLMG